jgi:hypothetical protein
MSSDRIENPLFKVSCKEVAQGIAQPEGIELCDTIQPRCTEGNRCFFYCQGLGTVWESRGGLCRRWEAARWVAAGAGVSSSTMLQLT